MFTIIVIYIVVVIVIIVHGWCVCVCVCVIVVVIVIVIVMVVVVIVIVVVVVVIAIDVDVVVIGIIGGRVGTSTQSKILNEGWIPARLHLLGTSHCATTENGWGYGAEAEESTWQADCQTNG